MKFAEIIREAGINPSDIPKAAELSIVLYDVKKREITDETIHFVEPIFEKNCRSRADFLKFLVDLEGHLTQNEDLSKAMVLRAQITESMLLIGSGVTTPSFFSRLPQQP